MFGKKKEKKIEKIFHSKILCPYCNEEINKMLIYTVYSFGSKTGKRLFNVDLKGCPNCNKLLGCSWS